jgi:hypothetical protein
MLRGPGFEFSNPGLNISYLHIFYYFIFHLGTFPLAFSPRRDEPSHLAEEQNLVAEDRLLMLVKFFY